MLTSIMRYGFRVVRPWVRSDRFLWPAARRVLRHAADSSDRRLVTTDHGLQLELRLKQYPDGSMYFGVYEVRTVRLIHQLLRAGDIAVDVGGNLGYMTLHMARAVGIDGLVITFEPLPENVQRLRRHLDLNQASNVRVVQAAVGEQAGELPLYNPADQGTETHARGSLRPRDDADETCTVPMVTLDEEVDRPVRLIKIDVEGAEVGVLAGAKETIRRFRPHIIAEHNAERLGAFGHTLSDLAARIRDVAPDYEALFVDGRQRVMTLDEMCQRGDGPSGNVWFRPPQ